MQNTKNPRSMLTLIKNIKIKDLNKFKDKVPLHKK